VIKPQIGGGLTWAKASYTTKYGKIVSNWSVKGNYIIYHVIIPKGSVARIELTNKKTIKVHSGDYHFIAKV